MKTKRIAALATLAIALLVSSCKKDDPIVATKLGLTTAPSTQAANRAVFPTQPSVTLLDNQDRIARTAGVVVTATIQSGGGTLNGTATATTDAQGTATFTGLSIAGTAGAKVIEFTAPGLTGVTAPITTVAGNATTIALEAGNNQSATVNTAVATAPSVKVSDADGNGVSGIAVSFSAATGGGSLTGTNQTSNASGIATVGSWTLGTTAGTNTMVANAVALSGSPVTILATATAGVATKLAVATAPSNVAQNRVAFPTQPAIRLQDAFSNNASQSGVSISAAISSGGGTLQGTATATTDANGVATFSNLSIAGTAGGRTLTFSASGLTSVTANVTTTAGAAASIAVNDGNNQSALFGTAVSTRPSAIVTDQDGNPVNGVSVTWAVTAGGGSATGTSTTTNVTGVATVGSWTLGPSQGTNTLTASSTGLSGSPVTFTATATTTAFDIVIEYMGTPPSQSQQNVFTAAVNKWRSVIIGDLGDVLVNQPASSCGGGTPAINETVDDLKIYVEVVAIDGVGQVLGSAGPCFIRNGSNLTVVGKMRFDSADIDALEGSGGLQAVILHEMGHVIGIGTLWTTFGLLTGAGTADPFFTGTDAIAQCVAIDTTACNGNRVPVEGNSAPVGTRDAHWRESVFTNELMTGFLNSGVSNPLSVITVGSIKDLGYVVNFSNADAYSAPLIIGPRPPAIHMKNDVIQFVPIVVPNARPPARRP